MRTKIHKSMLLVSGITLVAVFLIMVTLFYFSSLKTFQSEIRQETIYIQTAIDISGTSYLEEMDQARVSTRLTLIDTNGNVLYDSKEDEYTFQNHAFREEIKNALKTGQGEALRNSETVGKMTYYYAVLLKDGNVLRASRTLEYLYPTVMNAIPLLAGVELAMIVLVYFLSKWQTARLIRPINELDLENPLENEVYEEVKPLLLNMDNQNRLKEEAAKLRKEFSANVSHELRTPLTSISGYAEIMKSGIVKTEDMMRFSEKIYDEASRLMSLIEDIIKLSKLEEKESIVEKEEVNLYDLCMDTCNRLVFQAEKKNVSVTLSGEEVLYVGVKRILEEMIYNICENAIKYNRDGGNVKIWVGAQMGRPRIIIEDTGIGIPEEDVERIFERFYRVDKSHSKATGGTGLGLSIVKHGALFHKAEIHVESILGKGTKMKILF